MRAPSSREREGVKKRHSRWREIADITGNDHETMNHRGRGNQSINNRQ